MSTNQKGEHEPQGGVLTNKELDDLRRAYREFEAFQSSETHVRAKELLKTRLAKSESASASVSRPLGRKFPVVTDLKKCSAADGKVLAPFDQHRVQIGSRAAVIRIQHWANMLAEPGSGVEYQVGLDFGDRSPDLPLASAEAAAVIARLFPEHAG